MDDTYKVDVKLVLPDKTTYKIESDTASGLYELEGRLKAGLIGGSWGWHDFSTVSVTFEKTGRMVEIDNVKKVFRIWNKYSSRCLSVRIIGIAPYMAENIMYLVAFFGEVAPSKCDYYNNSYKELKTSLENAWFTVAVCEEYPCYNSMYYDTPTYEAPCGFGRREIKGQTHPVHRVEDAADLEKLVESPTCETASDESCDISW